MNKVKIDPKTKRDLLFEVLKINTNLDRFVLYYKGLGFESFFELEGNKQELKTYLNQKFIDVFQQTKLTDYPQVSDQKTLKKYYSMVKDAIENQTAIRLSCLFSGFLGPHFSQGNKRNQFNVYDHLCLNFSEYSSFLEGIDFEGKELLTINKCAELYYNVRTKSKALSSEINEGKISRNQILYGPPGTGKTYTTINKALEIINGKEYLDGKSRKELQREFNSLKEKGQIQFTTFHQSFSYEDFVEGIKPVMNINDNEDGELDVDESNENLTYCIQPGIFKTICENASKKSTIALDFEVLWNDFFAYLKSQGEIILTSITSKLKVEQEYTNNDSIGIRFLKSYDPDATEGKKVFMVTKNIIERLYLAKVDASEESRNARKDVKSVVGAGRASICLSIYRLFYNFASKKGAFRNEEKRIPYVLIIDEINRGNVSQIFGELITLIEDDKRLDKSEALEVTLPYSKDNFGVPSNLYIIGTMNTADRSVESLDTALRRRFSFTEMMCDYDVLDKVLGVDFKVNGIVVKTMLKTINHRLELLLNRDNQIGHAWFLTLNNAENKKGEFANIFQNKILPLLQEFFYADYGKIGMVLGNGFVDVEIAKNGTNPFASFDYDNEVFDEQKLYRIRKEIEWDLVRKEFGEKIIASKEIEITETSSVNGQ